MEMSGGNSGIRSRLAESSGDRFSPTSNDTLRKGLRFEDNYNTKNKTNETNNENGGRPTYKSRLPSNFFGNSWSKRPTLGVQRRPTNDRSSGKDEFKSRLADASLTSNFDQEKRLQNAASLLGSTIANIDYNGIHSTRANTIHSYGHTDSIPANTTSRFRSEESDRHRQTNRKDGTIPLLNSNYVPDRQSIIPTILKRSNERGTFDDLTTNRNESKTRYYDRSYNDSSHSKFKTKTTQENIPLSSRLLQLSSNMMNSLLGVGNKDTENHLNGCSIADDNYNPTNYRGADILKSNNLKGRIPTLPASYNPYGRNHSTKETPIQNSQPIVSDVIQETMAEDKTSEFLQELNKLKQELSELKQIQVEGEKNKQWLIEKERIRISKDLEIKKMEIEKKENEREIVMLRGMLKDKTFELEKYKKRKYGAMADETDSEDEQRFRENKYGNSKKRRQRVVKYYVEDSADDDDDDNDDNNNNDDARSSRDRYNVKYKVEMSPGLQNKVGIDKVGKDLVRMKRVVKDSKREVDEIERLLDDKNKDKVKGRGGTSTKNNRAYFEEVQD